MGTDNHGAPRRGAVRGIALALGTAAVLIGSGLGTPAWAQQGFPTRPVRFVVPYPPGAGAGDVVARTVAQGLSDLWGQQVIVDNKPGANEIVAAENVAHSPADGYTLLMVSDAAVLYNPYLYKKLPYDPAKDFAPISRIGLGRLVLAVNAQVPVNSLAELIAYAKKNPGKLRYGSAGNGGVSHLPMEWLKKEQGGLDMPHIPYRGTALAVQDILAGQVEMTLAGVSAISQHVQTGRIKAIAISGPKRSPVLPGTPTFAEAGYPSFSADYMFALVAPAGTPPTVVAKIAADLAKVVNSSTFHERVTLGVGMEPGAEAPAQFAAFLKSELPLAADKVKSSGATLD